MEKEEQIKEAFQRIKQDIDSLKKENDFFRDALINTRERMSETIELLKKLTEINLNVSKVLEELKSKQQEKEGLNSFLGVPTDRQTDRQTLQHINPTYPTHFKPLNAKILPISTGNEGVPTDRQTDRQTDRHMIKQAEIKEYTSINADLQENNNSIQDASKILDSLDSLKKEIRLKFKRLTSQEMLVFSTLYQLEEEMGYADYKSISTKLNLTESSIRDYIGKLIKKGIPIDKNKINNKNIQISISNSLKKMASLQTILHLRDL